MKSRDHGISAGEVRADEFCRRCTLSQ